MERTDGGRLRPLDEILGVYHRAGFDHALAVDHLDAIMIAVRQLAEIRQTLADVTDAGLASRSGLSSPGRDFHEAAPQRHRDLPCVAVADDRLRLVEADPHTVTSLGVKPTNQASL